MKKVPSNASLDRVITTAKMVALQSKGSNSSLNNLRNSLITADNPRRGSATGIYGLPVPPDSLKLGGTSHFQDSPDHSGRNSPSGWAGSPAHHPGASNNNNKA